MVAVTIIAVALVPLNEMLLHSKRMAVSGHNDIRAILLAQEIIETVKCQQYHRVESIPWQQVSGPGYHNQWHYRVTVVEKYFNLKEVTVEVRYHESQSEKTIRLATIKAMR